MTIEAESSYQISVLHSEFRENQAFQGAGLLIRSGFEVDPFSGLVNIEIDHVIFDHNLTTQDVNPIFVFPGGAGFYIACELAGSTAIKLSHITATDNVIFFSGDAGLIASFAQAANSIQMDNSYFAGNQGGYRGGALFVHDSSAQQSHSFQNNIFLKNSVLWTQEVQDSSEFFNPDFPYGGAVAFNVSLQGEGDSSIYWAHNTITENTVKNRSDADIVAIGGGIAFNPSLSSSPEEIADIQLNLYNNIIYGNDADQGRDIAVLNTQAQNGDPIHTINIHLAHNDYGDFTDYCDAMGDCDLYTLAKTLTENINLDPLFADIANDDVHLGPNSPAIDSGDPVALGFPPLDFDGNPRPFNLIPDMGALEAVPDIEVTPLNHNFGEVAVDDQVSVEILIANVGVAVLTVSDLNLQQTNDINFDVNGGDIPCGSENFELVGDTSCTVTATFAPQTKGNQSNVLDIASNDPDEALVPVNLSGSTPNGGLIEGSGFGCSLNATAENPSFAPLWLVLGLPLLGLWRRARCA